MDRIVVKLISIITAISFLGQNMAWSIPERQIARVPVHQLNNNIFIPEQYGRINGPTGKRANSHFNKGRPLPL